MWLLYPDCGQPIIFEGLKLFHARIVSEPRILECQWIFACKFNKYCPIQLIYCTIFPRDLYALFHTGLFINLESDCFLIVNNIMPIDSFLDPFRLFSCCLDSSFLHQSIIFCFLFPFRFFLLTQIYIKDILPFQCGSSLFLQIMGSVRTRVPPLLRLNILADIYWPWSTFCLQLLL